MSNWGIGGQTLGVFKDPILIKYKYALHDFQKRTEK